MPRKDPKSYALSSRVIIAVLSILLLGGMLVTASIWWNGREAARQGYDRILIGAANNIAEALRIRDGKPSVIIPVSAFELLGQAPDDRIYYHVQDAAGEALTTLDIAADYSAQAGFFDGSLNQEPARFVQVSRVFVERDYSGSVTVIVGQTLRARLDLTATLSRNALWPMALAGIALVLMAWAVVRRALQPLDAITDNLAQRDPYDLTAIPLAGLPHELQVTLGALNRFMARLDGQFDALRNLISDTAHQLRTPVAAIRVVAEAANTGASPPSRALDQLLGRTRSLGSLLDQLLSRALVVHRTDSVPRSLVDLRDVALDIMERDDHSLTAPTIQLRLEIGDSPVMVMADAFSLGEAGRNLLNNALRHGKSPVTLGVDRRDKVARLWLRDSGAGPSDKVLAHLGSRFNRKAGSGENSTGIGLSIVYAVAEAFGGRLEPEVTPAGFTIALVLPLHEETS